MPTSWTTRCGWNSSFGDLAAFLTPNLFKAYPARSNPKTSHVGSGDSVPACNQAFGTVEILPSLMSIFSVNKQYLRLSRNRFS